MSRRRDEADIARANAQIDRRFEVLLSQPLSSECDALLFLNYLGSYERYGMVTEEQAQTLRSKALAGMEPPNGGESPVGSGVQVP